MPALSISQLPAGLALSGAELLPAVQDGATVRTSVAMLRAGLAVADHIHPTDEVEGLPEALAAMRRLGRRTLWLPASAMGVPAADGAVPATMEATAGASAVPVLDFDPDTPESAGLLAALPKAWDGGALAVQLLWTATQAGAVAWAVAATALSPDAPLDAVSGTAVPLVGTLATAGTLQATAEAGPLTPSGTPSPAGLLALTVARTAGDLADTLAADARLIGLRLFYTVGAASDD